MHEPISVVPNTSVSIITLLNAADVNKNAVMTEIPIDASEQKIGTGVRKTAIRRMMTIKNDAIEIMVISFDAADELSFVWYGVPE